MSAKAVREYDGKRIIFAGIDTLNNGRVAQVHVEDLEKLEATLNSLATNNTWLTNTRLAVKPDQLIKRRGKAGMVCLDVDWAGACQWIRKMASQDQVTIGQVTGKLDTFIIEPFIPHSNESEHYLCIRNVRDGDEILVCEEGGVDVGDVDSKAWRILVPVDTIADPAIIASCLKFKDEGKSQHLAEFISNLHRVYVKNHFTYLEVNPLVVESKHVHILDLAAKIDETARFEAESEWRRALAPSDLEFPSPFGKQLSEEEAYVAQLDGKTGASLKLTVLNPKGRIWTMVAGGGASLAYADAITALGHADELANYGEYSGAPSETQTYEYARTLLKLMTEGQLREEGKVLFIGGGIANFTNVAATFKGIIKALREYASALRMHRVQIWVRRGGPNYQEGLRMMADLGQELDLAIHVYGPDCHITGIVPMALHQGAADLVSPPSSEQYLANPNDSMNSLDRLIGARTPSPFNVLDSVQGQQRVFKDGGDLIIPSNTNSTSNQLQQGLFTKETRAIVYGMQPKAIQGMLDFDYVCKRQQPSVACMVYPFGGEDHVQKFYYGTQELLVPVYCSLKTAVGKHPDASVLVNFASFRSVLETTFEAFQFSDKIHTHAIIAEGVPQRHTRKIIQRARQLNVTIIGPATVGGLHAGAFKIGNTAGMIDNILASRLYRQGSVSYVSKSGGMGNELNNLLAQHCDGVLEGVSIGGDAFPGSTLVSHLLRFEADPNCQMMVVLGEVGGEEEWAIVDALRAKKITKPVVAWCMGTCGPILSAGLAGDSIQFGHAGAQSNGLNDTADAKNRGLRDSGAIVPDTFEDLPACLRKTFQDLKAAGKVKPIIEPQLPKIPIDYQWAQELGLIRKPTAFVTSICDDRGEELAYAGIPISRVFEPGPVGLGVGGVVGLLWFRRKLPDYANRFIEMVLMLTADHGPAVSGAHNTIVAARAGKDLISSLASGLLTIGDRFGGASDGAAEQFAFAFDAGWSPERMVHEYTRVQRKLIMGIGHKIKSASKPDMRVVILKQFARQNFPSCPLLDYAEQVEQVTIRKKENLILNVDGAIGVLFVDLLRGAEGVFTREEADQFVKSGLLSGLFVLGRSIGFIGHYLDQRQLKQGLYRHPWDDISYLTPDVVDLAKLARQV